MRSIHALCLLLALCLPAATLADMLLGGLQPSEVNQEAQEASRVAVEHLNSNQAMLTSSLGPSVTAPLRLLTIKEVRTQVSVAEDLHLGAESMQLPSPTLCHAW